MIAGGQKKYWWQCSEERDHEWLASCENRIRAGSGCPYCYLAGSGWSSEKNLFQNLCAVFPDIELIQQARPSWLRRQHLDILFSDHNIAIEYQGRQHFEPVEFFGGQEALEDSQKRDARKGRLCKENGCHLIYVKKGYDFVQLVQEIEEIIDEREAAKKD